MNNICDDEMTGECIFDKKDKEIILKEEKRIFDDDVNNCQKERDELIKGITDPRLEKIQELFGKADAVSRENDVETNKQRLLIAVCGVIIILLFMFYGEVKFNFILSSISFALILIIYFTVKSNNDKKRHMKHVKYRVIAESLRAQFFVSYVGIDKNIFEMLPCVIKQKITVIEILLSELPELTEPDIKDYSAFFQGENEYHKVSIESYDGDFNNIYNTIINFTKIITFISFAVAFLFDLYILIASPAGMDINFFYFVIKVMMGLATMISLLMDELFGKMSLDTKMEDHERMLEFYKSESMQILLDQRAKNDQEAEELYMASIWEFLINASTKYVYLSKNNMEFILF